jgi:hypothetical protein
MKKVNLADFGDLLSCAEKNGYSWNQAHEILVNDDIPPMNESPTLDYYLSDVGAEGESCAYDWSDDTRKIMRAFFQQENIKEFTLSM